MKIYLKRNYYLLCFLGVKRGRENTGFPEWAKVNEWLNKELRAVYPPTKSEVLPEMKNPEIPVSDRYDLNASLDFWETFPKRSIPEKAETRVNVLALKKSILKAKDKMSRTEMNRAKKLLKHLQFGADSLQMSDLPPITAKNGRNVYIHGKYLTDTIGTWVKRGFVAGPFDTPPVPGFRANPLGVVVKNGKIRPILNMSGPVGASFNENVDESKMERLHMGTAKEFSYLLRDAGQGSKFSKFDIKDAYKLIPAKTEDFRLQGMQWLGAYFVDTQLIFGATPAVANYDNLGGTTLEVAISDCQIPRHLHSSPHPR